ncbi:hypothetical protein [Longitalea luteola]|uniref:hypothetical protein n=1 Tax=Longitalea luteola TaxID=2812563 RepID=UPI001A969B97|nr:hypothetical protein [Longitalea luteola]
MKKLLIATGISFVALSGCAYSQQTGHALVAANVTPAKSSTKPKSEYLNDINVNAMRDFVNRFGDVPDVVWHKNKDTRVAVFTRDSVQHRIVYNNRGDLSFIMKYYEENRMPRTVRAQVKSVYYDYKIFVIQEILVEDKPALYIVNLQDDKKWMKVKLFQGEMEVVEEFDKSK